MIDSKGIEFDEGDTVKIIRTSPSFKHLVGKIGLVTGQWAINGACIKLDDQQIDCYQSELEKIGAHKVTKTTHSPAKPKPQTPKPLPDKELEIRTDEPEESKTKAKRTMKKSSLLMLIGSSIDDAKEMVKDAGHDCEVFDDGPIAMPAMSNTVFLFCKDGKVVRAEPGDATEQ